MGRALIVTTLAGLTAATAMEVVAATPASATVALELDVGVQGFYDPGDHVVVKVTVTADQLLRGTVEARNTSLGSSSLSVSRDVDLAGGTAKDVFLVVPTSPYQPAAFEVTVRDGDRRVATQAVQVTTQADVELVGVLPALVRAAGQLPGSSELRLDAGTARLALLPPEVVDLGPAALEAYDTIAGLSGDLAALPPGGQASLAQWVERGGRLLLDDDADPVSLPTAWRPGAAGYVAAGAGEVRRSGGRAAAGRWEEVLQPGPVAPVAEAGSLNRRQLDQLVPQNVTLAEDAGLRIPGLGVTLALLAGYVLVVGPLVYFVLRRRRRLTAAWLVIPAVALLVAAVVVVGGSRLRSTATRRASTIVSSGPAGAWAETSMLVLGGGGGTKRTELPAGWWLESGDESWSGQATNGFHQEVDGSSSVASASLAPGEAQVLNAGGPVPEADGFTLTATADGAERGVVRGTVRNDTAVALDEVAVFSGNGVDTVGRLEAGAQAAFEITDADRFDQQPLLPVTWGGVDLGFVAAETPGTVDLGLWSAFTMRHGSGVRQGGVARAVGWTRQLDQPLPAGGRKRVEGRVAVTTQTTVEPAGSGPLAALAVRQELVRGPGFGPSGAADEEAGLVRFLLPPETVAGTALALQLPAWISSASWWEDGAGWTDVGPGNGRDDRLVVVPPSAVLDGAVFLRIGVRFDQPIEGSDLMVRGLAQGEVAE